MKFLCICLSPAIDATVRMDAWPTDGCIIKNAADTFAPGGKTVNVARGLAKRGGGRQLPVAGTSGDNSIVSVLLNQQIMISCTKSMLSALTFCSDYHKMCFV